MVLQYVYRTTTTNETFLEPYGYHSCEGIPFRLSEWNGISGSSDGAFVYGAIQNIKQEGIQRVNQSDKVFYFKCKNCGRKILVNVEKIDVLELSCRSCGSSEMEKL